MKPMFWVRPEKWFFIVLFVLNFSDVYVNRFCIFTWGMIITSITSEFDEK